jgi:outer membrane protein OmpA-like peptidoglycan-associated protein
MLVILSTTACSVVGSVLAPYSCLGTSTVTQTTTTATPGGQPPTIAVLVELPPQGQSAASDELIQARRKALEQVLDQGFREGAMLDVGVIGGPGESTLAFGPKQLKESGNNPTECTQSEQGTRDAVLKVLNGKAKGPTDVLSGLNTLATSLNRTAVPSSVDVVIISSMLSNTDELPSSALRQDPSEVTPGLRSRALLRDCSNWRVYVVGPGRTATGGPVLTLFADLDRFWDGAFRSCGGQLWGFQDQLTAFPATGPLPSPSEPPVCVTQTLPAGVFFDTGQSKIRSDAKPAMAQIVAFLRAYTQTHASHVVEVVGYTDSDGDAGANQLLSEQRAQSVAGQIGLQLPELTIDALGRGVTEPVFPNDSAEHKAANRRVVVKVIC